MGNDRKVIDLKKKKKKKKEKKQVEPDVQGLALCCPFCDGVTWGVNVDETTGRVDDLICISDECDGDTFVKVIDGILDDNVETYSSGFGFEPDNDD